MCCCCCLFGLFFYPFLFGCLYFLFHSVSLSLSLCLSLKFLNIYTEGVIVSRSDLETNALIVVYVVLLYIKEHNNLTQRLPLLILVHTSDNRLTWHSECNDELSSCDTETLFFSFRFSFFLWLALF